MPRRLLLAPFLVAFLLGAPGMAQPRSAQVSWVRGEGAERCPDLRALRQAIAERLGADPFVGDVTLSVEAVVERAEGRWSMVLYARDVAGELIGARELSSEADDCAPIFAATAFAAALAIDPELTLRPPAPSPTPPAPPPPSPPAPPVARPSPPRPRLTRRARPDLAVTALATGAYGLLPTLALGFALRADGRVTGRLRWSAELASLPESVADAGGGGHGFGLTFGALGACGALYDGAAVAFDACGHVAFGALHATAHQGMPVAPGDLLWAGATASGRLRWHVVGPLVMDAAIEALVPFTRYRFYIAGEAEPVFEPLPVAARASLGVGIRFR